MLVKTIFTHKLTPNMCFKMPSLFFPQMSVHTGLWRQRQMTHLCWLWNSGRYSPRQEVKQNLDSEMPWCLPTLDSYLQRQYFKALDTVFCIFCRLYFLSVIVLCIVLIDATWHCFQRTNKHVWPISWNVEINHIGRINSI